VRRLAARTPLVVAMETSTDVLLFATKAGVEAKRRFNGCAVCCDVECSMFARRDGYARREHPFT
jgi:hypothetical protein